MTATPVSIRPHPARSRPRVTALDAMPTEGPLVDRYGRVHRDLRLSVTDECNLRCTYCLPEVGARFLPHSQLLEVDELVRIARVAHSVGITSLRLTGGEPLLRREIVEIVARLADVGFDDLSLTTNGTRLAPIAASLAAAGLQRINISCDSLRPERFASIRRRGSLDTVLAAMDAAEAAGLVPLKVNVVVMAGVNDDEIVDFAAFARRTGRIVRFIEYMPLDAEQAWKRSDVVSGDDIIRTIDEVWPLEAVDAADSSAPAERFVFADGGGSIGVIASVTRPFCGNCDRMRITADGAARNCLFARRESSMRDLLRAGASDADLGIALREEVWRKLPGHGMNDPGFIRPRRSMSMIGG
ncbi:MAG: GTP 3',8-cyclase MoaA [Actinobacteria bacterium]|nr:GTP 3',8-cyclase MoaA [Actinomycetota bacterium]